MLGVEEAGGAADCCAPLDLAAALFCLGLCSSQAQVTQSCVMLTRVTGADWSIPCLGFLGCRYGVSSQSQGTGPVVGEFGRGTQVAHFTRVKMGGLSVMPWHLEVQDLRPEGLGMGPAPNPSHLGHFTDTFPLPRTPLPLCCSLSGVP